MSLSPGTRLGPYEIVSPLGSGGMGEVYRARDARLNREVAIKVLPSHLAGDAPALARFEQEARAVAALSHPHILAIHDFGNAGGTLYAVMELLEGATLRERLLAAEVSLARAVDWSLQIAQGLAAAHERGIVHRDLKPGNVFVTRDGLVKILDFGLALRDQTAGWKPARTGHRRARHPARSSEPSGISRPSRLAACRRITAPTSSRSARFSTSL